MQPALPLSPTVSPMHSARPNSNFGTDMGGPNNLKQLSASRFICVLFFSCRGSHKVLIRSPRPQASHRKHLHPSSPMGSPRAGWVRMMTCGRREQKIRYDPGPGRWHSVTTDNPVASVLAGFLNRRVNRSTTEFLIAMTDTIATLDDYDHLRPQPHLISTATETKRQPWTLAARAKGAQSSRMDITTMHSIALHPLWRSACTSHRREDVLWAGNIPRPYQDDYYGDALNVAVWYLYSNNIWDSDYVGGLMAWGSLSSTDIPWPVARLVRVPQQLHWMTSTPASEPLRIATLGSLESPINNGQDANDLPIKHHSLHWAQNALLLQIILYTAACFLDVKGSIPRTLVIADKGRAIHVLNQHLRSESGQASDSSIAGSNPTHCGLVVLGRYARSTSAPSWVAGDDARQGVFHNLGMDGSLAKNAIAHDLSIPVAHEPHPSFQDGPEFVLEAPYDNIPETSHNSPFATHLPSLSESNQSLGLHTATARILDDMTRHRSSCAKIGAFAEYNAPGSQLGVSGKVTGGDAATNPAWRSSFHLRNELYPCERSLDPPLGLDTRAPAERPDFLYQAV
ncbi:hypothetical protein ACRALDRAFT_2017659 [Sodiomyces alcalophilus JCM 7366]|uniref:uncharacterized protein n=1 Tax=Sodiomyces alcalophilus JCM 7366 TaxID=591952 RepID=UPI0039B5B856